MLLNFLQESVMSHIWKLHVTDFYCGQKCLAKAYLTLCDFAQNTKDLILFGLTYV